MKKIILSIDGMTCSACSNSLEKYLNKKEGIINASVNLVLSQALIEYEDNIKLEDLERFIKEAGFKSLGIYDENKDKKKDNSKILLSIYGVLALIILYISMSHMIGLPSIPYINMHTNPVNYSIILLILTIPFLIYGKNIFISGIKNIYYKSPNMYTLVTLGVLASFSYSIFSLIMILCNNINYVDNLYFESCAIIIYFIKFGRYIDSKSKEKTTSALKDLVSITPKMALIKKDNEEVSVTIDEVKKGDILICKPGMKIAVDGVITNGSTHLDEAFITGESVPNSKVLKIKLSLVV